MTQQLPKAISRQVVLDAVESLGLPINGVRKVELGRDEVVVEWIAKDGDNIEMPFTVSTTKIAIQDDDYRRKRDAAEHRIGFEKSWGATGLFCSCGWRGSNDMEADRHVTEAYRRPHVPSSESRVQGGDQ